MLEKDLSKVPDFTWLINAPHRTIARLQADIVDNVPTVVLDEQANPKSRRFMVMILNNSCDLPDGRTDFVTAVPVLDFQKYLKFERAKRGNESFHV